MKLCYLNKTDSGSFFTRVVIFKMASFFGQRSVPLFHPWFSSNKAGDHIANGITSSGLKSGTEALDWYSSKFWTAFKLNQWSWNKVHEMENSLQLDLPRGAVVGWGGSPWSGLSYWYLRVFNPGMVDTQVLVCMRRASSQQMALER